MWVTQNLTILISTTQIRAVAKESFYLNLFLSKLIIFLTNCYVFFDVFKLSQN